MKKLALFLLFIAGSALNSYSQFYISGNGGYSFPTGATTNPYSFENRTDYGTYPDHKSDIEILKMSLGKGVNAYTRIGYSIFEGVFIEVGVNYLKGASWRANQYSDIHSYGSINHTQVLKSQMIFINPSVGFQARSTLLKPYARMGFLIGKGSILMDLISRLPTENEHLSRKYSGGLGFGFNSALGIEQAINTKTSFTFEISLQSMSYGPNKMNIVFWEVDGQNVLESKNKSETQYILKDQFTKDHSFSNEDDKPRVREREYYPFGSIGFSFGVKFHLSSNK